MVQYELFLAMLYVTVYYELFLVLSFVTVQYKLFGHVLRGTFTVQEQFQLGVIGCCAMLWDLVMSVMTALYKRMSMRLGYWESTFVAYLSMVFLFPYVRAYSFGC